MPCEALQQVKSFQTASDLGTSTQATKSPLEASFPRREQVMAVVLSFSVHSFIFLLFSWFLCCLTVDGLLGRGKESWIKNKLCLEVAFVDQKVSSEFN